MDIFAKISHLFGEHYETPGPNPRIDEKIHLPEKDSGVELDISEHDPDALFAPLGHNRKAKKSNSEILNGDLWGASFCIEYEDANGNKSFRRILLCHLVRRKTGDVILSAHCLDRNAPRHFWFDRIISIVDEDGEAHHPVTFFENELSVDIKSYLTADSETDAHRDTGSDTSDAPTEKPGVAQRNLCRDGLRFLVAISRSDGDYHPLEIAVILNFIVSESELAGITTNGDDEAALLAFLKRQRPDEKILRKCLSKFAEQSPETRKRLFLAAENVILADGKIRDSELSILQRINF